MSSGIEHVSGEVGAVDALRKTLRKDRVSRSDSSSASHPSDNVIELSEKNAALIGQIKSQPDIHADRLPRLDVLKEQIESGEYKITDAMLDSIAQTLLDERIVE